MASEFMRITFIFRSHKSQRFSIEKVFHNVISELEKYHTVTIFRPDKNKNFWQNIRQLRKIPTDIFHITGDINYYAIFLPTNKTILTIHDIGHYIYSIHGIKKWLYKYIWFQWPIFCSAKVTSVSENTKNHLIKYLKFNLKKLEVIPNAIPPDFDYHPKPFNSDCPTILQVGTKSYKNVPGLIKSLQGIKCRLILVGKLTEKIEQALKQINNIELTNVADISDEELKKLYIDCDMVSFVSFGEGFGVPIIEANAIGRPIITSNVSPLKDIAGNAAVLVNPENIKEIHAGIQRIIEDENFRNQLISNGLKNAENFKPSVIAQKYMDLYKSLNS